MRHSFTSPPKDKEGIAFCTGSELPFIPVHSRSPLNGSLLQLEGGLFFRFRFLEQASEAFLFSAVGPLRTRSR